MPPGKRVRVPRRAWGATGPRYSRMAYGLPYAGAIFSVLLALIVFGLGFFEFISFISAILIGVGIIAFYVGVKLFRISIILIAIALLALGLFLWG